MAMVSVVNWQRTGGLMVQADRLGPKVGGHLVPCCIHHVNQGELSQCFKHNDSTIKIVLVLLLLLTFRYEFTTAASFNKPHCLNFSQRVRTHHSGIVKLSPLCMLNYKLIIGCELTERVEFGEKCWRFEVDERKQNDN